MNTLLPILLSWLQIYSYPALWACVFIAAVGAPLPISLILLALGAFAALGDFNIVLLTITATTASICGDSLGYILGRKIGPVLLRWLEQRKRIISPRVLTRSQEYFQRRGAWAIFLSRCVFPALGGTINLLAGIERYPFHRFFIYDVSGELIGAVIPLALGYAFGASWEAIGELLSTISLLILALLIAIYLFVLLIRTVLRMSMVQEVKRQETIKDVEHTDNETKLTFMSQNGKQD